MGVLDYFTGSSPDDRRREEVRTGAVAPDRSERKRCWEARDKYFACLDRHDVIDPVSGEGKVLADKNCAAEDVVFGQDCATAWVCPFSSAPPLPFLSRGLCGESWVEMWSGRWKAEVKSCGFERARSWKRPRRWLYGLKLEYKLAEKRYYHTAS